MPQSVIERDIPNAGELTDEELRAVSLKSLEAFGSLGPQIQESTGGRWTMPRA